MKHMNKATLLTLLATLFSTPMATAMEAALDSIEANNTMLSALHQQNEAERLSNNTGLNLEDPEVEFTYMWGQPSEVPNKVAVGVSQSFDFATLSGAKRRVATRQNDMLALQYKQARVELLKEARIALVNLIYNNAVTALDNRKLGEYRQLAETQRIALERGDANVIGLNKINLELVAVENEVSLNKIEREAILLDLQRLNGGKELSMYKVTYPAENLPLTFEEFYAQAEMTSPMLAYVRSEIELSREQLSLTKSEGLPTFSVGYVNELMAGDNHHGVAVGLSIPLWSNSGKVKAAKAAVVAAQAQSDDAVAQFYGNVRSQYERTMSLRKTAREYASIVKKLSSTEYLTKALQAGQISIVDYINENKLYYEAIEKSLEAERDYRLALAELQSYLD